MVRHIKQYSVLNTEDHPARKAAPEETLCSGETHQEVFSAEYIGPPGQEGSPRRAWEDPKKLDLFLFSSNLFWVLWRHVVDPDNSRIRY